MSPMLPLSVAGRVVPLLPSRFQRFRSAETWEEAAGRVTGYAAIQRQASHRLESETILPLGSAETRLVAALSLPLQGLAPKAPIRVIDAGGAQGQHWATARAAFPSVCFEWTVMDLPEVVHRLSPGAPAGLCFVDGLDRVERADVVLASAFLHYMPDPWATLNTFLDLAPWCVLLRTPLWPMRHSRPASQHPDPRDRSIGYPTWFLSPSDLERALGARATVVASFDDPDDRAYFAGHYGSYQGLVIQRRDHS